MKFSKNVFRYVLFISVLSGCLVSGALVIQAAEPRVHKKILVLNSYHAGYKGSDDIVRGFSETLRAVLPDAEIKVEYLDSKNYGGAAYDRQMMEMLRFKYRQQPFDLIVSTDDYAFNVLEEHRNELFGTTPVVFCGTNDFDPERIKGRPDFIGIDERPSFADTLGLIFSLHPNTKKIIAIHDDSITGQLNSDDFSRATASFVSRADFSYWSGKRLDELIREVGKLQPGTVVVYFASFVLGGGGERFSSIEALNQISAASKVPIYGGWEFNLGAGIVGGRLINLREHGRAAAQLAARILKGEAPARLTGLSPSPNQFMFDYQELKRFNIPLSGLPADRTIINLPPTLFSRYGTLLLSLLSAGLLLTAAVFLVKLLRSRRELQRSQVKFSTIFSTSPDLIAIIDRNSGRCLDVNDAFVRVMGFSRAEVSGRNTLDLGLWASADEQQQMQEALGAANRLVNFKTRCRRKNGDIFTALVSLEAVEIEGAVCFIISARDITERIQMESALRESEAHYRAIIDAFDGFIYICSADYRIEFMNERLVERTGHDATGELCFKALHGLDGVCSWCQNERVLAGERTQWEIRSPKDDRWYQISNTPIENADGTVSKQSMISDITARKLAEEQIIRSLREKEVLLKEIHHRVKNNMQVIYSLLNLQARGITDGTVRAKFEESRDRVNSMALIHEKLYGSEDLAHIDFKAYLESLVAGIADSYMRKGVAIAVDMEPLALDVNVGIPCGLIVNELVSNSLKYAFPEGKTGSIRVGIMLTSERNHVLFVEDNGIGLPEDVDFRNTSSLGLQLVNGLTGQIQGTIGLSRENGTKFSITFPGVPGGDGGRHG